MELTPQEENLAQSVDVPLPLVLNQYRRVSSYKDIVGERYHFPNRYLKSFAALPVEFVYYEPRDGGEQVYFGTGIIRSVLPDTEDAGHSYGDIDGYRPFPQPISFYAGPAGSTWEPATTMRNSVRRIRAELFYALLQSSGLVSNLTGPAIPEFYEQKLKAEWDQFRGRIDSLALRRKRRVAEAYERPSWVTNKVKRERGPTCQLCGLEGFVKRDGARYCEVHHLFHLADEPPDECLGPEYLVVLCANCHRRMHYASVGVPTACEHGWTVMVDDALVRFTTGRIDRREDAGVAPDDQL